MRLLDERFGEDLYRAGFRIYTSLDLEMQAIADSALKAQLTFLETVPDYQHMPYEGVFWDMERERVIGSAARGCRGVLELFIDAEMQDPSSGKPRFFEVTFGRPYAGEITDDVLALREVIIGEGAGEVRLLGRIDRVDVAEADGEKLALAVDYKTGSPPPCGQILKHISLQIPIYMMALQNSGSRPAGGAYYCLKDNPEKFGKFGGGNLFVGSGTDLKEHFGVSRRRETGMFGDDELAETLDQIRGKISEYASGIRSGEFYPSVLARDEAGCQYCAFSGICRKDDSKTLRMGASDAEVHDA